MTDLIQKSRDVVRARTKGRWVWRETTYENHEPDPVESELATDTGNGIIQSWDYEGYSSGLYIRKDDAAFIAIMGSCADELFDVVKCAKYAAETLDTSANTDYPLRYALEALEQALAKAMGEK